MKHLISLAVSLVLVAGVGATATADESCEWTPRAAIGPLCGDPWTYGVFDNRQSDAATVYKLIWFNETGKHTTVRSLKSDGQYRSPWRRVKLGSTVRIKAWQPGKYYATVHTIARKKATAAKQKHWGTGACPNGPFNKGYFYLASG